jgi:transcriptional regulator with GAF, ATPase, and Fis domain/tetratricopeptide (TPR) repeat protein
MSGLDSMLRAAEELNLASNPCALFIDDADLLDADEIQHLEAVLRSLPADARVIVVVTAARPLASEAASVMAHEVAPLSLEAIRAWTGPLAADERAADLSRLTGGNPAYLESALVELASGRLHEADLRGAPRITDDARVTPLLHSATAHEKRALALVVARRHADTPLPADFALDRFARGGLLTRDADGYRLARPADSDAIERCLGDALMLPAFRTVADHLRASGSPNPTWLLHCLVRSRQIDAAARLFATHAHDPPSEPRRWSDALDQLGRVTEDGTMLLNIAQAHLDLGLPERSLSTLARLLRLRPDHATRVRIWTVAGTAHLHSERPTHAARYLKRALFQASDTEGSLAIAARLVRALNQTGSYAEAATLAKNCLSRAADRSAAIALELASGLGIAATFLGDTGLAQSELTHVAEHLSEARHPRDAARVRSYLAILAFRSGDFSTAAAHYTDALDIAERAELTDMLPTLVLNLGTARQQLGDWGDAISLYERGHRVATALGKAHAQAILQLNLANLFADVGLADRAQAMLERAQTKIGSAGIDHLDGHQHTIAAEIAIARNDLSEAHQFFNRARHIHRRRQEPREEAEALINIAWTAITKATATAIAEARVLLDSLDAADVAVRFHIVAGLHHLGNGHIDEAIALTSRARQTAEASALPLTAAEACAALATAKRTAGLPEEADELTAQSRRAWARVAETLPRSMRDAFWSHPRRRAVAPDRTDPVHAGAANDNRKHSERFEPSLHSTRLRRVLELRARVSSSLSLDRVLELAMDAAIELTGAERGFLLLGAPASAGPSASHDPASHHDVSAPAFHVAVARNVDRKRLGHGELEFSTSIAKQVMRSGEALLTLDARGDKRLASHRSVHAMRLKSVACVPVSARGSTLGALYLDNRFERGRFGEDDIGVVLAFANHIAMAIRNAQLHAALQENHRRLAAEKRRVERLSRGQARQIEALEKRVLTQQRVLERRYDYAAISHRSPAMREVLDVLDRVIDSDLTVLVEGESGTGKELVARAIHFNSPRKHAPFVGVNCGALSETLLESELFGHVRGAFTGADRDRAGLMVAAEGGTLFLDEVGELSLAMQVKLLRALQEREVRPVGSVEPTKLDVRVVCATNRHLRDEVASGRFREDLYYRLGVVEVALPPLRDRQEDIIPIARHMLQRNAEKVGSEAPELSRDAVRALLSYRWPGNVRQLENVLARAYVLSDRAEVHEGDLDLSAKPRHRKRARNREEFESGEAERIHDTLLENRWNVSRTARALGLPRNTLYRKMSRLGLTRP